jgi:hypothetical protein
MRASIHARKGWQVSVCSRSRRRVAAKRVQCDEIWSFVGAIMGFEDGACGMALLIAPAALFYFIFRGSRRATAARRDSR